MTKASPLFLAIVLFGTAGLYGCTNQKNTTASAKMRDMEIRFTKLEEDYRAVVAIGAAHRKKLVQVESQNADLTKEVEELRPVVADRDALRKERDELRTQLVTRTGERDNVHAQLTQFRQDLQGLIGRVDAALNTPGAGGKPVPAIPASRKSE